MDQVTGIDSILASAQGKMIASGRQQDKAAVNKLGNLHRLSEASERAANEAVADPIRTGVPEMDQMTVPGGGVQEIGTEFLTSEMPEYEPNDQEYMPSVGPGTEEQEAEGDTEGMFTTSEEGEETDDGGDALEQLLMSLDTQTLSHGDDEGNPIQPTSPGSEEDLLPGEDPEEIEDSVGGLIDNLIENRARVRRRRQAQNVGQTGNPTWDEDDGPDSTNPPLDAEAPEDYFGTGKPGEGELPPDVQLTYPATYPEMRSGTGGQIPKEPVGKPGVPVKEAVRVRRAIDLILEGRDANQVASSLLGD